MKMIVGLGNPGKEYENTRHNVGFLFIDNFAKSHGVLIDKKKFNGLYAEIFINNEKVILLKPLSYMNLSGNVVKKFVDYFDISVSDILVISDDLALDFGKFRLRLFGSSGGHNGLKNIEQMLGSNKFKRFRVGISSDKNMDTKDYVLGRFNFNEHNKLMEVMPCSIDVLNDYCILDFERVMSKYN